MAIEFHPTSSKSFHVEHTPILIPWIESVIRSYNKEIGDINIIYQTDDELLALNRSVLDHDYYTDIITFDYCTEDEVNGDLFISIDRIQDNANTFAVSFEEEFNRVIIHGIFHLLGFGDKSEEEKITMRQKENEALELLKRST